jgi:hypothetical protein
MLPPTRYGIQGVLLWLRQNRPGCMACAAEDGCAEFDLPLIDQYAEYRLPSASIMLLIHFLLIFVNFVLRCGAHGKIGDA